MQPFKRCTPSQMSRDQFISTFADIYEHSPWIAQAVFEQGITTQQDDKSALHLSMQVVLNEATDSQKLALINAHPDLAGKAAIAGELTDSSTAEQAGAGIHLCTDIEYRRFSQLNEQYKEKFNFPFIMAVKGSDRHQIIAAFEKRIHNSVKDEFNQALIEINKIALFRLNEL